MILVIRSTDPGAGKSWAIMSFNRPKVEPKRLIWDGELRDEAFQSDHDDPATGRFVFDLWGDLTLDNFVKHIGALQDRVLPYNFIGIDNGYMFQEQFKSIMQTSAAAEQIAKALGVYGRFSGYLGTRFNVNEAASYSWLCKNIIREWLLLVRKAGIDMVVSTESKNVWENYGKRGRDPQTGEPYMKIKGQSVNLWPTWIGMADAVYIFDRMKEDGKERRLLTYPIARVDPWNPKCSLPGLATQFEFKDWSVVWKMLEARRVPTKADLDLIRVPGVVFADNDGLETNKDALNAIFKFGKAKLGWDKLGMEAFAKEHGFDLEEALYQYFDWIEAINERSSSQETK